MKTKLALFTVALLCASSAFAQTGKVLIKQSAGTQMTEKFIIPVPNGVIGFDGTGKVVSKAGGATGATQLKLQADMPTSASSQNVPSLTVTIPANTIAKVEVYAWATQIASATGANLVFPATTGAVYQAGGTSYQLQIMADYLGAKTRYFSAFTIYIENNSGSPITITPQLIRNTTAANETTVLAGTFLNVTNITKP